MAQIPNDQIVEIYKTMLTQEVSNHTITVYILLGITIILLGAAWWWNKQGVKKTIEIAIKKKYEHEQVNNIKLIKELVESEFKIHEARLFIIEADIARIMGISASQNQLYHYSIGWFAIFIIYSMKSGRINLVQKTVLLIISQLKSLKDNKIAKLDKIKEAANLLPEYLNDEKKEINELLIDKIELEDL